MNTMFCFLLVIYNSVELEIGRSTTKFKKTTLTIYILSVSGQMLTNSGFVQVSTISLVFNTTTLAISGHIFGLYGQGAIIMLPKNKAFHSGLEFKIQLPTYKT